MPGRLPVVPRQPPPLLPGATADRAFKVFLLKLVVAVGAVLVLVEMVQLPEWPTAVTSLLVLGLGVTALVLALVLRGDGSVSSAPDRSVLPPGWYPSPHRQAERELWTGAAWSNQYEGG